MYSRTEHSFHRRPESRIAIEVISPIRAWVFRVDEPHFNPALHHPVQPPKNDTISRPLESTYMSFMS